MGRPLRQQRAMRLRWEACRHCTRRAQQATSAHAERNAQRYQRLSSSINCNTDCNCATGAQCIAFRRAQHAQNQPKSGTCCVHIWQLLCLHCCTCPAEPTMLALQDRKGYCLAKGCWQQSQCQSESGIGICSHASGPLSKKADRQYDVATVRTGTMQTP